jgi:hypothetical protein
MEHREDLQRYEDSMGVTRVSDDIDILGELASRSDVAVVRIVEALGDSGGYDMGEGTGGYTSYWKLVSDHAFEALYKLEDRRRALPHVLRLLDRVEAPANAEHKPAAMARYNILRFIEWSGPAAAAAEPVLARLTSDPDATVRATATAALAAVRA